MNRFCLTLGAGLGALSLVACSVETGDTGSVGQTSTPTEVTSEPPPSEDHQVQATEDHEAKPVAGREEEAEEEEPRVSKAFREEAVDRVLNYWASDAEDWQVAKDELSEWASDLTPEEREVYREVFYEEKELRRQPADSPIGDREAYDEYLDQFVTFGASGPQPVYGAEPTDPQLNEILWALGISPEAREEVVEMLDDWLESMDQSASFEDFILDEPSVTGRNIIYFSAPLCINFANGHGVGTRDFDATRDRWDRFTERYLSRKDGQLLTAAGVTAVCPDAGGEVQDDFWWGGHF